jgi:hypothetical protein
VEYLLPCIPQGGTAIDLQALFFKLTMDIATELFSASLVGAWRVGGLSRLRKTLMELLIERSVQSLIILNLDLSRCSHLRRSSRKTARLCMNLLMVTLKER